MASSTKTKEPDYSSKGASSNELLDELASFLYDAHRHEKQKVSDTIEVRIGQNADNKDDTKQM